MADGSLIEVPENATLPQLIAARRKLDEQIALLPLAKLLKLQDQVKTLHARVTGELASANVVATVSEFAAMSDAALRKALIERSATPAERRKSRPRKAPRQAKEPAGEEAAPVTTAHAGPATPSTADNDRAVDQNDDTYF